MINPFKTKKGLGRGLSSLIGDSDIKESKTTISISSIIRNKFQPRKKFNKENLDELTNSIKERGIIQPIIVRKSEENKSKYEIIAGERRWLAAQKAGLHQVPIILLNASDSQSLEIAIVENIQREDLNSIEEAKGYVRLMKEFNYDHDKLAKFMGKSRSHISNTLRLLSLPEDVIALVEKGKLTAGQVRPLIGMHNAVSLARDIIRDKLSARSIENLVRQEKGRGKKTIYSRQNSDTNILLEQRLLEEKLGLKVNITNKKNNSGKVTIEYKSLEQFELLSKILKS